MDIKEEDAPKAFVDWSKLHLCMSSINSNGIKATLLMKLDGSLLSVSGIKQGDKIISALVANIWKQYESQAIQNVNNNNTNNTNNPALDEPDLEATTSSPLNLMLINCEEGIIAVTRISRFLLSLYCSHNVSIGEIKIKMTALKQHLQPLNRVYES